MPDDIALAVDDVERMVSKIKQHQAYEWVSYALLLVPLFA